jgi:hypothetical protein
LHLLNSGELPASFSGETVHFRCKWTPPWSFPRQALHRDGVGHANPTSTLSSSPTPASSSPTPASSSIAVVHLWPKVSTPSRSSRRFLSVLLFNLQFRGHSHLILLAFSLCACTVRIAVRLCHCRPWIRLLPLVSNAGEDLYKTPFTSFFRSLPRLNPRSPEPLVVWTGHCPPSPVRSCTWEAPEVEDKVALRISPLPFL